MPDTSVISIQNLSKRYRLGSKAFPDTIREALRDAIVGPFRKTSRREIPQRGAGASDLWALNEINLEIGRGEVLGVIGKNGAGKTTLLKILSRITEPTDGEIVLNGSVSSLLQVGAGFHPELTGRENIYLNGAILGMRKAEIKAKFDQIVEFAEIGRFLDTPIKRYSSGMYVRLAFSIGAHLDSDILLIDEVLAVGDYEFQKRCLARIDEITRSQRTVLFVSHNLASIEKLCNRSIVLDSGKKVFDGETSEALQIYCSSRPAISSARDFPANSVLQSGNAKARFTRMEILAQDGNRKTEIFPGESLIFKLDVQTFEKVVEPRIAIGIKNGLDQTILTLDTRNSCLAMRSIDGDLSILCSIRDLRLMPGKYSLNLWLADRTETCDFIENAFSIQIAAADIYGTGKVPDTRFAGNVYVEHSWKFL